MFAQIWPHFLKSDRQKDCTLLKSNTRAFEQSLFLLDVMHASIPQFGNAVDKWYRMKFPSPEATWLKYIYVYVCSAGSFPITAHAWRVTSHLFLFLSLSIPAPPVLCSKPSQPRLSGRRYVTQKQQMGRKRFKRTELRAALKSIHQPLAEGPIMLDTFSRCCSF